MTIQGRSDPRSMQSALVADLLADEVERMRFDGDMKVITSGYSSST